MNISWRMRVYESNGVFKDTIDVDDQVVSLNSFNRDGVGSCGEADFEAIPSEVPIRVRDVVQLQVSTDGGGSWESVFMGTVVVEGAQHATDVRSYTLVGLKQRLYEITLELDEVTGDRDVMHMVNDAILSVCTGLGFSQHEVTAERNITWYSHLSPNFMPLLGFNLGDHFPALESLGDFLDTLAEKVGAFIVPPTSSYTYDGITYHPDETVPPVEWGVAANGVLFFRRPQDSQAMSEADDGTMVLWNDVEAEEVADRVHLVYASKPGGKTQLAREDQDDWYTGRTPPAFKPLYRSFGESDEYGAERVVPLEGDYILDLTTDVGEAPYTQFGGAGITNLPNVADEDFTTYAEADSGVEATSGAMLTRRFPADRPQEFAVRIRAVLGSGYGLRQVRVDTVYDSGVGWARYVLFKESFGEINEPDGYTVDLVAPILQPLGFDGADFGQMLLEFLVQEGDRIYLMELRAPDVDDGGAISEAVARSKMRVPPPSAAEVTQWGALGDVTSTVLLTPRSGGDPYDLRTERVEVHLSKGEGLRTVWFLGAPYQGDVMSHTIVTKQAARRAVTGKRSR